MDHHSTGSPPDAAPPAGPFRCLVREVDPSGRGFRAYAGTVVGGAVAVGDAVCFVRTGETAGVSRLVGADGDRASCREGDAVTLVLDRQTSARPGDLLCAAKARATLADQVAADIAWTGDGELIPGRQYLFEVGGSARPGSVTGIRYRIDPDGGEHIAARTLRTGELGRCNLGFGEPIAFDPFEENRRTGSFAVIDRFTFEPVGRGMIRFALRRAANLHWQAVTVDAAARAAALGQQPRLVWFTGLSGSGKSTIADIVERKLHAMGRHTYLLDGDNVRHGLNRDLGFTDADRVENLRRVAEVARLMLDAGLIVIASFISPFRDERQMARDLAGPAFVEVFVDTPLATAEARDPKGLYAKARSGKLRNFTGIDSPYEAPLAPELVLDTLHAPAERLADRVVAFVCAAAG